MYESVSDRHFLNMTDAMRVTTTQSYIDKATRRVFRDACFATREQRNRRRVERDAKKKRVQRGRRHDREFKNDVLWSVANAPDYELCDLECMQPEPVDLSKLDSEWWSCELWGMEVVGYNSFW